ncbi:M1 family aminopeptidase [Bremerella sp. T1]|uniref:M1 family aminopeptidase n=1 Tax=Bremerella sp. TYQ1 TaxID=3119568 RepID=UPI001CCCF318|nr:M1 family aminopeptidase [Bremerella volcania]UBM35896.1 M1 family metallopeptidase [Bremerella volcania]
MKSLSLIALFAAACLVSVVNSSLAWAEEAFCTCRYCESHAARLGFGVDLGGDGPHYAPVRKVDVQHIKLDITPDFKKRTVGGSTTIRFVPLRKPLDVLKLDAVDLSITSVEASTPVDQFDSTSSDLTIAFAEPIPVGQESWVTIEHHCQPQGGFYFRTAEMGYPEEDTHCWTQGESHYARQWFPCFDYPNEKSTTEVICHVPSDMTVVSNGRNLGESIDPETKLKSVHWLQEKPHVNYLICVVAGYFDKLEDRAGNIPLGFYSQPTLSQHAAGSFQDTASIMAFYQKEIGVAYPWHKYDQVTIRDFIAGGMENTTITTLTHNTIFTPATENIRSSRGLDAHELAHQWFGDYVTCEDWSHLWLNEGFATYYTHLYEGEKFGRDATLYGLYRDATNRVLPRGANDKRPIVWKKYRNAGDQFDYRAYPKGSWVLHMLRSQMGEELFREAIQSYLKEHGLTTVTTPELQAAIEETSGRTFDRFFDQWVYHARHPDLKIRYRFDPKLSLAQITLEQTHKVDDDVMLFNFPATFAFLCDGEMVLHTEDITEAKHDFYVSLPAKPEMVQFDPEYTLLTKVDFDKPEDLWISELENAERATGRILAIEALAKKKSHKAIEAIQKALENDSFYGVQVEAAEALGKINSTESREALRKTATPKDARVRLALVKAIVGEYQPEQLDELLKAAQAEQNPAIVAAWIDGLAKYSDESVSDYLRASIKKESFRNEIAEAAVDAMQKSGSSQYVTLLSAQLEDNAPQYTMRGLSKLLKALATLSGDDEKLASLKLIAPHLNDARPEIQKGAIEALGKLDAEEARPILQSYADASLNEELSKAASSALAALTKDETAQPKELIELRKQMQDLEKSNDSLQKKLEELEKKLEATEG